MQLRNFLAVTAISSIITGNVAANNNQPVDLQTDQTAACQRYLPEHQWATFESLGIKPFNSFPYFLQDAYGNWAINTNYSLAFEYTNKPDIASKIEIILTTIQALADKGGSFVDNSTFYNSMIDVGRDTGSYPLDKLFLTQFPEDEGKALLQEFRQYFEDSTRDIQPNNADDAGVLAMWKDDFDYLLNGDFEALRAEYQKYYDSTYQGIPLMEDYYASVDASVKNNWAVLQKRYSISDATIQFATDNEILIIQSQTRGMGTRFWLARYLDRRAIMVSPDFSGHAPDEIDLTVFKHEIEHMDDGRIAESPKRMYTLYDGSQYTERYGSFLKNALHYIDEYNAGNLTTENDKKAAELLNYIIFGTKLNGEYYFTDPTLNQAYETNIDIFNYKGNFNPDYLEGSLTDINEIVMQGDLMLETIRVRAGYYSMIETLVGFMSTAEATCTQIPELFQQYYNMNSEQ